MLSKAYGILKDRKLAETALCDAFVHIYRNIKKIGDPKNSRSIVFAVTIARNCAYALLPGKNRDLRLEKDKGGLSAKGLENAMLDMPASETVKIVNQLGGENKNIFLLKYEFGFSNKRTAGTLNETEINIAARLQKAQKKLRALLLRGWDRRVEKQ